MANHESAVKRHRQSEKRRAANRQERSTVRTLAKQAADAIESGDAKAAADALRVAESRVAKAASKGILKKKTASRKISRMARKVHRLSSAT
ncbi:30S ribosomal protein S20 [bacterium]|nr:30S ribosomal protein S20 [bacterium]